MSWEIHKKEDISEIKKLIIKKEWAYVSFSARFRDYLKNGFGIKNDCIIIVNRQKNENRILEAVMLLRQGIILPLLELPSHRDQSITLKYLMTQFMKNMRKLHSIIGLYDDVQLIEEIIPLKVSHHVDYYLMTISKKPLHNSDFSIYNDIIIKKAELKDADKLYPLQKMYELEEVFIDPSKFNPRLCLTHFKKILKSELIIYAEINGVPVAKAGTNAQGFFTDQIGGVYTKAEQRRKGIASCLMYSLLERIFETKKDVSLFVKKNNTPAISFYKKIGFHIRENFRISYYT